MDKIRGNAVCPVANNIINKKERIQKYKVGDIIKNASVDIALVVFLM